jgi:hypothetical protein
MDRMAQQRRRWQTLDELKALADPGATAIMLDTKYIFNLKPKGRQLQD